jgi:hypothetical protein
MVDVISGRRQIGRQLPLPGPAGYNSASCREKNTLTPGLIKESKKKQGRN